MNLSDSTTPPAPTVEVTRWKLPVVTHSEELNSESDLPAPPTAEEIAVWEEEGRQRGYEEGYKIGLQAGRDAGDAEVRNIIEQISSLIDSLDQPFKQLDEQVENELMLIIVALAQQLVRRELRHEPGEIIAVIRESMALLPANDRSVRVNLHPDDAALIRETLASSDNDRNWTLVEDPLITRGGCRIGTEVSKIDVTLEARLASLAATMLGGEREGD
jgi:flagellar assembly protein FliH